MAAALLGGLGLLSDFSIGGFKFEGIGGELISGISDIFSDIQTTERMRLSAVTTSRYFDTDVIKTLAADGLTEREQDLFSDWLHNRDQINTSWLQRTFSIDQLNT